MPAIGIFLNSEAGVGNAGHWSFLNIRNRRWECRQLTFLKKQKPPLGMPVIEIVLEAGVTCLQTN